MNKSLTNQEVWGKIKTLDIEFPVKTELFQMIEDNLDRVEFVKDHVGLRDFMFIAEKNSPYLDEFFVAINVECEKSYTYKENLELFFEKLITNRMVQALRTLMDFFEKTDRVLYVGIGFKDGGNLEKEEVLETHLSGKFETYEEVANTLREFPEWYEEVAKNPKDCHFLTVKAERYINEVLKPMENESIQSVINEILLKEKLTNEDKNVLQSMAARIKK